MCGKDGIHQKASPRSGHFCKRGEETLGSWCGPRQISKLETWRAPPPIPTTKGVWPHQGQGQKEHSYAIHWGCHQPLPEQDLSAEVPTVEPMGFKTTQEEIQRVYNEYTNQIECLEWNHVMWKWWRISTKKSLTPSRSTSVAGRAVPSQQRNQDKDPPVLPGQIPDPSSSKGPKTPMTTSGI